MDKATVSGYRTESLRWYPEGTPDTPDISLIIACYCEEPHLRKNSLELVKHLSATRYSFEIIFVEDASPDGTRRELDALLPELAARNVPHQAIYHAENRGRGRTVQDGMEAARGRFLVYIDIDLEHLPNALLPILLRLDTEGWDVVVARRVQSNRKHSAIRWFMHQGYRLLVRALIRLPVSDTAAGFKAFNRERILPVLSTLRNERWFWDTEIIANSSRMGLKITEHPVIYSRHPDKVSTVKVFRDSFREFASVLGYVLAWHRKRRIRMLKAELETGNAE